MEKNEYILIGAIALIVFALLFFNLRSIMTSNVIKQQEEYEEWLKDNCVCTGQEKIKCPENYEYEEKTGFCRLGNTLTNPSLACSEFECDEGIIKWDGKRWQKETE